MPDDILNKIFANIEKRRSNYPQILREVSQISTVEDAGSKLPMTKIQKWAEYSMKEMGAFVTVADLGFAEFNGVRKRISPVVHGIFRASIKKPTVCVYCHLESFPEKKSARGKELFGNGVVDAKGPLLCWFYAIQSYKSLGEELPVNIKFLIENTKDYEVPEFFKYLRTNKSLLFEGVKYICVPESPVLEGTKPLITYGYRGCCKFEFTVDGGKGFLDSGKYSGAVQEVMVDTVALLQSMVDSGGAIKIAGLNNGVAPVSPEEEKASHASSFSVTEYKQSTGAYVLLHKENKKSLLMNRSRYPSLSIHGVDTQLVEDDLIPTKAKASFTVTIVPHQIARDVQKIVKSHLEETFKKLKSKNTLTVEMPLEVKYWLGNSQDENYKAACKAVGRVIKEKPELIRRGTYYATIADLTFVVETISIVLLPVGYADSSEALCVKSDIRTFMDGVKIVASYIYELSKI